MKKWLFFVPTLLLLTSASLVENNPTRSNGCANAYNLNSALNCAGEARTIICYSEEWPPGTNSTMFFNLINGNQNLTDISFCRIHIDSIPASIGKITNLTHLQLPWGTIEKLPKEIGKLKKLKTLVLGRSTDECRGNAIKVIPKEIGECESLEELSLAYSEVEDLPAEIINCKNLKTIDLKHNPVISEKTINKLKVMLPGVNIISNY